MTLTGLFIENDDKNNLLRLTERLEWHLRAKTVNICYIDNFGFLLKKEKQEKLMILVPIFSYVAVKYERYLYIYIIYIYYERPFII